MCKKLSFFWHNVNKSVLRGTMATDKKPTTSKRVSENKLAEHDRRGSILKTGKYRSGTKVNPGVAPKPKPNQVGRSETTDLVDGVTALAEEEFDSIFSESALSGRLGQLFADNAGPASEPEPYRIVTKAELLGEEEPFFEEKEITEEIPTIINFPPIDPPPPDDNGGGGGGDGDGAPDYSTLPPPPAPSTPPKKTTLNRLITTAAQTIGVAYAGMAAYNLSNVAFSQMSGSNGAILAATGGVAALAGVKAVKSVGRRANGRKLHPEWRDFQSQSGWGKRQCLRWQKEGFSPQEAQRWAFQFYSRPGQNASNFPLGGTSTTIKEAKAFKYFNGKNGRVIPPEEAGEYIRAWVTPQGLDDWITKYRNPSNNQEQDDVFFQFVKDAHMSACEKFGYGYKSSETAMRVRCEELGIVPLRRWDQREGRSAAPQRTLASEMYDAATFMEMDD
jgi:hypothetical protein